MRTTDNRPRALITGNNGFTGRQVVRYARERALAYRLIGLDLRQDTETAVDEAIIGDLHDTRALLEILGDVRPAAILHLAGCVPPASDERLWAANVEATRKLLESIAATKLDVRVVVIGSAAEYGASEEKIREGHPCNPTTPYGRAKLAQTRLCERYAREFGLDLVVARAFNLYGPGMSAHTVIGEICRQIAEAEGGGTVELGNVASARDFIDIRDAAAAYWTLARRDVAGGVYNVCSGRAVTIGDIAQRLIELSGKRLSVRTVAERMLADDFHRSCGDYSKLLERTGWSPTVSLSDGLRDTLTWFVSERSERTADAEAVSIR